MVHFAGLDVHKRVVEACVLDEGGHVVLRDRFPTSRQNLERFASRHLSQEDRVALEATTNTWPIVAILKPFVAEVVISNPLKTRAIAEANVKTDKVDAFVLAQLLRTNFLPRVWEPDDHTQLIRRLTSRRSSLVGDRVAVKNRIHSVLHQRLISCPHDELFSKSGRAWLDALVLDDEGRRTLDSDLRLLESVGRELTALDDTLASHAHEDPRTKLLMTIPGVDFTVAQTLIAALGDISRFKSPDSAAAYLGLTPSTVQSADHCYHGPITKAGSAHTRWLLVQAAQHIRTNQGPLGVFYRHLRARKNHNVAVCAVARKFVVIAWHMLNNNEPYRYAAPRPTEGKLQRLRVRATHARKKTGPKTGTPPRNSGTPGVPMRTIKPLSQIYAEEGIPPISTPKPGELKTVEQAKCKRYVLDLNRTHVVPRNQHIRTPTTRPNQDSQ